MKHVVVARWYIALSLVVPAHALARRVREIDLVADRPGVARHTDPNLVNPWGLVVEHDLLRVADNHSGLSTLYREDGRKHDRVITIPPPNGTGPAAPTGMVSNHSDDFVIRKGWHRAPAELIFATEDGTISAWSPFVDRDEAILEVNNSGRAVYKGLAMARHGHENFLYATNFFAGLVEIYDERFRPVGSFTDPDLQRQGYAPFGIRNLGGHLFVTFALPDDARMDDVPGPGHGFVDIFDADGHLLRQFAANGDLNSPWGLELAGHGLARVVLVGNFGDGRIHAFDFLTGTPLGALEDSHGAPLVIDGLWAISFEGDASCDEWRGDELFFTAGPNDEQNGLLGVLLRR